ncbi:histone-like nucleoid-structuring protein Lsr2 [Pseudactinotalea terrae]|uniref:histone-like nucleoid-structuring protein Lsr2 n=1 Tax=Pseudactinotalea terrae TaxID=1743262 RepID=UPI0012E1EB21|nr:Lsr2 family protein [Pseudactinotalea terrae]
MASKTVVELIDDLDGTAATQTIRFAVDGVSYEIDLNDKHAAQLREALEKWTSHGRRVGGRRRAGHAATNGASSHRDLAAVREWAKGNGHKVSDRGRVPQAVLTAYDAAH